jgi:hypothetical protein
MMDAKTVVTEEKKRLIEAIKIMGDFTKMKFGIKFNEFSAKELHDWLSELVALRKGTADMLEYIQELEKQEKYAELGRLALDAIDKFKINRGNTHPCEISSIALGNREEICVKCAWYNFCQKRTKLLAGVRDVERLPIRDTVRCSCCGKSFDVERMLTNCDNCGLTMLCDNCYEKHECEWDGE